MNSTHFTDEELRALLSDPSPDSDLTAKAAAIRKSVYGNKVFIRGLIEFTNYCKNDCYYCGIRAGQRNVSRYRLTSEEILDCCRQGYNLGFRTFVLQGGEDLWWNDDRLSALVASIKENYPDCAVTLSVGERSRESYQRLFDAGADRYLLRHETADTCHYAALHPGNLTLENRMRCLHDLRDIGYQTGCGFMVGSPGQTVDHLIRDLRFIEEFRPHMVGIGPFLPAAGTPFACEPAGSADLTLKLLSIIRLMHPEVLLPATTALGTAEADGRERGILAGANVIMPNLSPPEVREKYMLYDNKIATGDEAAESVASLRRSMKNIGYEVVTDRGDYFAHK
ncbi:MAG: [Firmicutes bacterium]|nr:[FeFe] hydrogenase H-cluster radical SAM maturase HydE [Bacillota bacterium]